MRYIWHVVLIGFMSVLAACHGIKRSPADAADKDFSPLLYAPGQTIAAQHEGRKWNPALWPLSYQNKDRFTRNLFAADIVRDQYIEDETVPILVVGPNFYHLSDLDQKRVCDALNDLYGATSGSYGAFLLMDWHTKKIIGEYSKGGLMLR